MHVAVFADIEGSFGIWRRRQCHTGTSEWQYGRACLTADVNSVVNGAFDGGADKVTVKDTHDTGFNILTRKLDPRAYYVGGHYINPSFFGRISEYDLILYVAIHAASGTPNAFFPHTHLGVFDQVRLNGRPVSEMTVYGAYLGEYGLPIGYVSGEEIAVKQALESLPWAKSVTVDKRKETYTSGDMSLAYLSAGRERLRDVATDAVRNARRMEPLVLTGPLHFEAEFRTKDLADRFNTWNFTQIDKTVSWDAHNMIDGMEKLNKLTFFPKRIYPVRRQLMFLARIYYRLKHRYLPPDPNAEDAALQAAS